MNESVKPSSEPFKSLLQLSCFVSSYYIWFVDFNHCETATTAAADWKQLIAHKDECTQTSARTSQRTVEGRKQAAPSQTCRPIFVPYAIGSSKQPSVLKRTFNVKSERDVRDKFVQ